MLHHTDRIHDDEVRLAVRAGRHSLKIGIADDARAPADHLLEVGGRLDAPHEQQNLNRLDVGAGGDHVDRDGDAGEVAVAELSDQLLRVLLRLVGDLPAELVPLAELLPNDAHDRLGVVVVLGEDQRLRQPVSLADRGS